MHNNIMAAGSKDRPPMLGPGRYSQWRSPNEMWIAIKRLQQGESLNVQDVKTNLFWEFGKFTSRDGNPGVIITHGFTNRLNELTRKQLAKFTNASECLISFNTFNQNGQAQRDKEMQKNCTTCKVFKKPLQTYQQQSFELLHTPGTRLKIPRPSIAMDNQSKAVGNQRHDRIGSTLQLMQRSGVSPEKAILLATLNRVQNHDERKQKDFKAIKKANASLTKNWKSVKTNLDETNSALWKSTVLDETPEVLKDFLTMIQRNLQAQVITVRTDRGTEFLNKTLHAYFKEEGIEHQTSTPRTPEQNGVVERRNRTLVEAARTMLSASKLPLSFWAEAVATACYTQNNAIINHSMERRRITHYDCSDLAPQTTIDSVENVLFILILKDKRRQIMTTLTPFPQDKILFLQQKRQIRHNKG
ncbi:retrovirus-related pol polyprotein from transposon TNT 1-94 [Tanacetum coccineum]|uniref:Retrovirus-related pol polyprotein from transposon TNT 1-94 n=1 Tax=Tanacetum coccineum TaxID=301880 RepID=A0ABQ5D6S2_9ASTR